MQIIFVALSLISAVSALPNGAPVCTVAGSAVQNQHLVRRPIDFGNNEDKGYQITLNGVILQNPVDPTFENLFQFGSENILVVTAASTTYLKGVLIIASGIGEGSENIDKKPDEILDTRTPQALTIKNNVTTKESIGCENFAVSSIVHTENSQKSSLDMYFKWPTNGQLLYLDVNIVKNNNLTVGSQYAYQKYAMRSGVPAKPPTPSPAKCGLLNLSIFCPLTFCGVFGKLIGLCDN
jgi:hypothetical protein